MKTDKKSIKRFSLKNLLKSFTIFDLVLLAMLTGLSIAFKAVVGNLVRMITGPLGIPGGALAGGFYMLWLPLAIAVTNRRGSALVISAVQTIVMITTGAPGSHGVWTIFTYMLPAILVELVFIYRPKKGYDILQYISATFLANLAGTFGSNLLFFRLSLYPLLFTLLAAALSGVIGGIIAYFVLSGVKKSGVLTNLNKNDVNNTNLNDENSIAISTEHNEKEFQTDSGFYDNAKNIIEDNNINDVDSKCPYNSIMSMSIKSTQMNYDSRDKIMNTQLDETIMQKPSDNNTVISSINSEKSNAVISKNKSQIKKEREN